MPEAKRKIFQKNYYPLFTYDVKTKGQLLFDENSPLTEVYIIRKGEVVLSMEKSIAELHKFSEALVDMSNNLVKQIPYYHLKMSMVELKDEFANRKKVRIFDLKENEMPPQCAAALPLLAPLVGLEPTTLRLTAACSTD